MPIHYRQASMQKVVAWQYDFYEDSQHVWSNESELYIVLLIHSQKYSMINPCDRRTTLLSDTDISFALFNLFTYFLVHFE
jgi:hypothetical protein